MKAYKYKIKPNGAFEAQAEATLDACRELYNAAVQERRDAWRMCWVSINRVKQNAQLPDIKKERPDIAAVHSQVLQDVLMRVDKAFDAFFRRCRNGETLDSIHFDTR